MRHKARLGSRFWRLWSALGISSVGDGMISVALPLLALQFTRSALAISAVLVFQQLPGLLASLPIGALADRVNRRKLIVTIEVLRFAILAAFGLAVLTHRDGLLLIYITAFLLGGFEVAFDVVCGASLPSIVKPVMLVRANARLINAEQTAEDLIGRALGGAALTVARSLPFLADAASFVASALLLRTAVPDNEPRATDSTPWQDLTAGIRWFAGQPILRLMTSVVASFAFCQSIVFGVLVLYGRESLNLSGSQYGLMLGLASVGVVLGGFLASPVHDRLGTGGTVLVAGVLSAVTYPVLAMAHDVFVATAALMVETAMVLVGKTAARSLRQRLVPDDMQARAASAYAFVILGSIPLGSLAGGLLVSATSIRSTFMIAGLIQLGFLGLVGQRLLARIRESGESRADRGAYPASLVAGAGPVINLSEAGEPAPSAETIPSFRAAPEVVAVARPALEAVPVTRPPLEAVLLPRPAPAQSRLTG